jgi:hypothetical protein
MTLPVAFDHALNTGQDQSDSGTRTTVGAWGQVVAFKSPLIAFHTGVEFPRFYVTNDTHVGTAGFASTLSHRDVTLYELIGFHSHSRSIVQTAGVIGFGIVFSQTNDRSTNRVYGDPQNGQITTLSRSQICPSFIGGVDIPVRLSNKVALVIQARGHVTLRRRLFAIDDIIYGRFAYSGDWAANSFRSLRGRVDSPFGCQCRSLPDLNDLSRSS